MPIVELTEDQMCGMYKLLALSKYNDRFVIPSDVKVSREGRLEMQQNRGFACPEDINNRDAPEERSYCIIFLLRYPDEQWYAQSVGHPQLHGVY